MVFLGAFWSARKYFPSGLWLEFNSWRFLEGANSTRLQSLEKFLCFCLVFHSCGFMSQASSASCTWSAYFDEARHSSILSPRKGQNCVWNSELLWDLFTHLSDQAAAQKGFAVSRYPVKGLPLSLVVSVKITPWSVTSYRSKSSHPINPPRVNGNSCGDAYWWHIKERCHLFFNNSISASDISQELVFPFPTSARNWVFPWQL